MQSVPLRRTPWHDPEAETLMLSNTRDIIFIYQCLVTLFLKGCGIHSAIQIFNLLGQINSVGFLVYYKLLIRLHELRYSISGRHLKQQKVISSDGTKGL